MEVLLRSLAKLFVSTAVCCVCSTSYAEPLADGWQLFASRDSAAAIAMIENSHPGAARELGDTAFQARLALAKAHVAERLSRVATHGGYAAVIEGLAADFGDDHIHSSAIVGAQRINTAGIILVREGGRWVVGGDLDALDDHDLAGATLLSCDGEEVNTWASPRIAAFRGDPTLEAVRAKAAAWLLLDYDNPFMKRPTNCRFRTAAEKEENIQLHWRPALARSVQAAVQAANRRGAAEMKVEPINGGWWIGLQTLDDTAAAVVDKVRKNQASLRAAPLVVMDLRGNGGGNSQYTDVIARLLVGDRRFDAAEPPTLGCGGQYWRVSPDNLAFVRSNAEAAAARSDHGSAAYYRSLASDMEQALVSHHAFSPALPACAGRPARTRVEATKRPQPPSAMRGRLVIVTDNACFSSCLIAVNTFIRLGAVHLGEETDRSTHYMEVRESVLPSGMRTFYTLMKVDLSSGDFGPYSPAIKYRGRMDNDAALKAWIVEQASSSTAAGSIAP